MRSSALTTRGALSAWTFRSRCQARCWGNIAIRILSIGLWALSLDGCIGKNNATLDLPRTPTVLKNNMQTAGWAFKGRGMPSASQPAQGVVLITVDTLRADPLSPYGGPVRRTPNIERLATGSVLFEQAFATCSTTSPSHASIMTSLYLEDHKVYSNFEALGADPATLAQVFRAQGFATYAIVNMAHLNPEVANLARGFETYIRSGNQRGAGATFDHALQWLDQHPKQRFFAWIHLADVHTPYHAPTPYDTWFYQGDPRAPNKDSRNKIWPLLPTEMAQHPLFVQWLQGITDADWISAQYKGAVSYVDHEIGRFLDQLEQRHKLDKTAVLLTSDHGENLGEHNMYFVHTGLYDTTVHVPLIAYFPDHKRKNHRISDLVQSIDIMPTLLEYFGLAAPEHLRGHSLWPLIHGNRPADRTLFMEHAGQSLLAARTHRYKYIQHLRTQHFQPAYPFVKGHEELYDVLRDPQEKNNLALRLPQVVHQFRQKVRTYQKSPKSYQAGTATLDAETLESLQALGYVR